MLGIALFASSIAVHRYLLRSSPTLLSVSTHSPTTSATSATSAECNSIEDENPVKDCIIIGAGISGLQCASELRNKYSIDANRILLIDAQDYIGGRVKQDETFIKGVKIDLGAEILHGSDTKLNEFARTNNQPTEELFCWAHGDGGPDEHSVNDGYGLYYISGKDGTKKLLRYDDKDGKFVKANESLWKLENLNEDDVDQSLSLHEYLVADGIDEDMMSMAAAGYSNTLCANSKELSLKGVIRWTRYWNKSASGDSRFNNTYKCLIDHLKEGLRIKLNQPIIEIDYSDRNCVKIKSKDGNVYKSKCIVVTVSVAMLKANNIVFRPALPTAKITALDSLLMNRVMKIFVKFSKRVWPKHLHGMIMSGKDVHVPEAWFRDVSHFISDDEEAVGYAVGFATAAYADYLSTLSKEKVLSIFVAQLDDVFSHLQSCHMDAVVNSKTSELPSSLSKPSEVFIGGFIHDWKADHPYIGGGYASLRAGKMENPGFVLSQPLGEGRVIFAGEATNPIQPGATAHAAMESGIRAAKEVSIFL